MLLVGRFMEETANFESNAVMKKYKVIQYAGVNKTVVFNNRSLKKNSVLLLIISTKHSITGIEWYINVILLVKI